MLLAQPDAHLLLVPSGAAPISRLLRTVVIGREGMRREGMVCHGLKAMLLLLLLLLLLRQPPPT